MSKLKNLLSLSIAITVIFPSFLSPLTTYAAYNQTAAQTYLQAHANNPWVTLALASLGDNNISSDYLKNISGSSATDFEAPILAITSLGQDPKTFGNQDLVAKLKSFHADSQLGDSTLLNDDIFGVLALTAAGLPSSDTVLADSKSFILGHQNSDGGWGFSVTATSDSNTTAAAMVALLASGLASSGSHISAALNYLKTAQNSDGGFTYDPNSSFGTTSDTSSTSWAMWALNALNINPATWNKGANTPDSYLEANQAASGYFKYQSSSNEDSFSAVTTSYAVIALAGKTLPLKIVQGQSGQTFPFRIEGSNATVCEGQAAGPTALDIVKNASTACGFTYHIKDTSFGPYLDQIGTDAATGNLGWLYRVNWTSPDLGAGDYQLKTGDEVLWYYGDFTWPVTKLTLSSTTIDSGGNAEATVEYFSNNSWQPLLGATAYAGTATFTTDNQGHASISGPDGYYKVYASKTGFVRSNSVLLKVGQAPSGTVSLSVNVGNGQVQGTSTQTSTISFTVDTSSLNFGNLDKGASSTKNITIKNTGTGSIHIESVVAGDSVFVDNLKLNSDSWRLFKQDLIKDESNVAAASLTVPQSATAGQKSGQLVFWATAN